MIRPPNLNSMKIPCPKCNGDAKLVKPSFLEKIKGNRIPGNWFKCKKCKYKFMVQF